MNPAETRVYVSNQGNASVSVMDTANNSVVATTAVGMFPQGVTVNPAGTRAYVANFSSNNVSVIDTATNAVCQWVPRPVPSESPLDYRAPLLPLSSSATASSECRCRSTGQIGAEPAHHAY